MARRVAAVAALVIASAVLFPACVRRQVHASAPPATRPGATIPAPGASVASVPGDSVKGKPPFGPSAAAAPLAAAVRGFGLGKPSAPKVAEDYSLGPLQSVRPASGDESAVFAVATAFVKGIAAGTVDRKLLLPQSRDALSALLAPASPDAAGSPATAAAQALPYRLGAIVIQGPDASLRLRLPAPAGAPRVEGLLSLRKVVDTWYVEALALNPPVSGPLAFNPDSSAAALGR